ncbi:arginine repressor [Periweissella fabalis]|uniref:Arginine repressor n=1 Tax=Periweissella fabalis TaxID=1070421 RepID=A0A7X6S377_9LACO|nr:hypothetical protein [Periweissella fabalis]MCM0598665.1 hypothetical protein [Periweissella fabalis]NKZ24318.1 hypothetical protein [Periweissella fabalis]
MRKQERHDLIRRLVQSQSFERQDQLVYAIEEQIGKKVTQATISRDLRELNLIKVRNNNGNFNYQFAPNEFSLDRNRLARLLSRNIESLALQDSMILLKVIPGTGEVIGNLIEAMDIDEIFAVMVNDAKVMLFIKDQCDSKIVANKIRDLL